MKIILSRKGFDSSTGGFASPIIVDNGNGEEGQLLSLPIPVTEEQEKKNEKGISYNKLRYNGISLSTIIKQLTYRQFKQAHLDPDLCEKHLETRPEGWTKAFGQTGSAQTYLKHRGVKEDDLFLFFGWFKQAKYDNNCKLKYVRGAKNLHVIFGWLQVGKIIEVEKDKIPSWLNNHPHVLNAGKKPYDKNNTIYVSAGNLSFKGLSEQEGGGVFSHFKKPLQLTAQEEDAMSHWCLPKWLYENYVEGLWSCNNECCVAFDSNGNRQEFVFDVPEKNKQKAIDWLKEMF